MTGELGDLLLQVLFYSQMASEEGHFSVDDVLDRLSNKLVDRHPHVFGEVKADTPAEVLRNWESLKAQEKEKRRTTRGDEKAENADDAQSVLSGVSSKMPALMEAYKLSSRAAHVGFDWPKIEGLFAKLEEETVELREELEAAPVKWPSGTGIAGSGKPNVAPEVRERLEDEVGDLFFVLVNIARYLSLDPESALRKTNRKFKRRFQWMEGMTGAASGMPSGTATGEVTIRKCEALEEMRACFPLQKEVWKFADADLIPVRMFVVAAKVGGQVIGAFVAKDSANELVGFALAIPGMRNGYCYLHSQMLAVRLQYRNGGLGRRMKLYQREEALDRGFELMEWTFDPLEIKNAYLNIEKLGAIARRYNVNQYGVTSSPLQGGLPTDRLVAEWWMKSKRVEAVLADAPRAEFECRARVEVPAAIYEWKADAATRAQALAVQGSNRERFQSAFAEGLSVLGYERDGRGNGQFLLGDWDEARR